MSYSDFDIEVISLPGEALTASLKAAILSGSMERLLGVLKENKEDLDDDYSFIEAINCAIETGNQVMVSVLLALEPKPDSLVETLINAAEQGANRSILKLIVAAGPDPFPQKGLTGLHWAAQAGSIPLLELMWARATAIFAGFPIDIRRGTGATPLHTAAEYIKPDAAKFLIDRGANVRCVNVVNNKTPLQVLAGTHLYDPDTDDHDIEVLTHLFIVSGALMEDTYLNHGVLPSHPTHLPPLIEAAATGKLGMVKALVERGANINATDSTRKITALHVAMMYAQTSVAFFLVAHGADVNARNDLGRTPLHVFGRSAEHYGLNINALIREFVRAGADINARDGSGDTPLYALCRYPKVDADFCPGCFCDAVNALLVYGADINAQNALRDTCLHAIVHHFASEMESICGGMEVSAQGRHVALNFIACIQTLCTAGADAGLRNRESLTPLRVLREHAPGDVFEDQLGLMVLQLILAGDYRSWDVVPYGFLGLGAALHSVWRKFPEELPYVFAKLDDDEQVTVQEALKCLHRYLPHSKDLGMRIISEALDYQGILSLK